jgi:hypothetical protein
VVLRPVGDTIRTRDGGRPATGKEPIGTGWGKNRPTDETLRDAYARTPGAGVGLLLGPDGGVVDFECDGPRGEESLRTFFGADPPETVSWSSRRGRHRLFRWDDRLAALTSSVLHPPGVGELELRIGGRGRAVQSAVPPTRGEDGHPRAWGDCATIAHLPDAVVERILELATATPDTPHGGTRAERWFRAAVKGEATKVAAAPEGQRHKTLFAAARTLGGMLHHGFLTAAEITAAMADSASRAGLPANEVEEVIRDGLTCGAANPLPWPPSLDREPKSDTHSRARVREPKTDTHSRAKYRVGVSPLGVSRARLPEEAVEHAAAVNVPPVLRTPRLEPLARLLIALSEGRHGGEFFVSLRDLDTATGIPFKTVRRRLARIGGLGHLELVEPGDNVRKPGGTASVYRWHDPPVPGGAPWNNNRDRIR